MRQVKLGQSGVTVSEVSLGTMTFGNQTPEDDAHRQMSRALDAGVTFFDCAEMYPVNPVRAATAGDSERFIGNWFASTGQRDRIQIATKATGPGNDEIRGAAGYDGATIRQLVEDSLRRLQTDRIDLYQLHWPDRGSYHFRKYWVYDPSGLDRTQILDHMAGVLTTLGDLVKEGKIRAFGLSNETAWGTARWLDVAERIGGPRVASVQNEYSLLCRIYDTDMAELSVVEDVVLLAYSPLAAGLLTGKYQNGAIPEGSRMETDMQTGGHGNLGGRKTDRAFEAVDAYLGVAGKHGIDPVHMALGWTMTRPFRVIPIIGATTDAQLAHALSGMMEPLPEGVLADIEQVHRSFGLPY